MESKGIVFEYALHNSNWGGVISCDFWQEDWYTKGDSERTEIKPESSGGGSGGAGGTILWGNLRIDAHDESSIWWGLIRDPNGEGYLRNDKETLTDNKTYTLHAGFQWGARSGEATYTDQQKKDVSADAIAVSGVTVSWTVDSDPDGAVASLVPSADTRTCAVTIDHSKLQTAPNRSTVAIKATITSEVRNGYNAISGEDPFLGSGRYGQYFLTNDDPECRTYTATVYLSK